MEYIIPALVAYTVFLYNYRKVIVLKNEIYKIKRVMDEGKFWDKLDKLSDRMTKLEISVSKLETKIAIYSSLAVFITSVIIKFADKVF